MCPTSVSRLPAEGQSRAACPASWHRRSRRVKKSSMLPLCAVAGRVPRISMGRSGTPAGPGVGKNFPEKPDSRLTIRPPEHTCNPIEGQLYGACPRASQARAEEGRGNASEDGWVKAYDSFTVPRAWRQGVPLTGASGDRAILHVFRTKGVLSCEDRRFQPCVAALRVRPPRALAA